MTIAGVNPYQGIYKTSAAYHFRKISEAFTNSVTAKSDTVSISNEARGLSIPGSVDINDPKVKADLKALAIPDWYVALLPKEALSNPALGTPYTEMYKVTGNEEAVDYCKTKLSDVTIEEIKKSGISGSEIFDMRKTQPDQYKEYDKKLYQAVRNSLLSDEKYVNYMKFLGIPI